MAEQFYSILTSIGKAKIANANTLGNKLNLTTLVLGDGNGKYYNPTENQEAIVNEVWKGTISSITTDSKNPNWIVIETIIAGNVGGFFIREVGIFDDEGSLIAIGKYPETYKPVISDGSTKDLIIRMILEVSNSANVTLKIDPAIIMATKKDVEVLENKIKDLKGVYAEDLLDETVIIEGEMHPVIKDAFEKTESQIKENKENLQEVTSQMAEFAKKEELSKTTSGSSGAKSIGVSTISGLTGNDVQTCLQNLFQFADNGKKNIASVIGSPLTSSDTFNSMKSKIQTLKNTFASNLITKEQNSSGSESLQDLINKISNISVGIKAAVGSTTISNTREFSISGLDFKPSFVAGVYNNANFFLSADSNSEMSIYALWVLISDSNIGRSRKSHLFFNGGMSVELANGTNDFFCSGTWKWVAIE
ncbi:phage tail protein [Clostridium sp. UBA6640]|uniref:phage tail protein n=1 Tax=Clostridium sp. UBA6640 TaxID=1946370 RepID=UPI0025B8B892|nr:phage tail protein [Clostridium sp. UBA6640]